MTFMFIQLCLNDKCFFKKFFMQHGEKEQVYCIETKKSDGGRQCVGARKGMSEKGEECFLPYLRAWTHNGKMLYEEEKERCQSK